MRQKGVLKGVSYLLGVKAGVRRGLEKDGGLASSLSIRRVGADDRKVRGRMGDAGGS